MPQTARQAMVMLTQSMFPYHGKVDPMDKHIIQMSNQLASSTTFQISLYFNAYFFPFWATSNFVMLALKFDDLSAIYQILLLACLVFMTLLEVVRLYLGYVGNLQEQVISVSFFEEIFKSEDGKGRQTTGFFCYTWIFTHDKLHLWILS